MNRKWLAVLAISLILLFAVFALSRWAAASTVFSDDFSGGGFNSWSRTYQSTGASQSVSDGVARFIVPTPIGGTVTYAYLVKDGFTSTVNSTIVASQDIHVAKVPNGCQQGNGAIFFLYICDSQDLAGNYGNIGVGIDGSSVWSLWIGGNTTYTYIFQTSGSAPVSNTWYRVVLAIDNSAGLVSLSVDGVVVVSATQQQFTNRTHTVSLMSGMGEAWWSDCVGPQEIDVDNVKLDVSDADSQFMPSVTVSSPTTDANSIAPSTQKPTVTPTPGVTETVGPSGSVASVSPTVEAPQNEGFPLWILLPVLIAVAVCGGILFLLKKR